MTLSSVGEFGLIEQLARLLPGTRPADVVVGIGDDAAVVRFGTEYLVVTTDTMVEGVHFLPGISPYEDIGWKSLASNVSDLAAMGSAPLFALVTLALPSDTPVGQVEALYRGLGACAERYAVTVVGGDIVRAPQLSVTVVLLGRSEQRDGEPLLLRRSAAVPGDVLAVTGAPGDAAAGLRQLQDGAGPDGPLPRAHLHPEPPLATGIEAADSGIRCGIDVSDGLLQDIGHICEMSQVGAVVRAADIPISDELRGTYPDDALRLACTGGEDYQLVLAAPRAMIEAVSAQADRRISIIGEIVESTDHRVRLMDGKGDEIAIQQAGWDAFRS